MFPEMVLPVIEGEEESQYIPNQRFPATVLFVIKEEEALQ